MPPDPQQNSASVPAQESSFDFSHIPGYALVAKAVSSYAKSPVGKALTEGPDVSTYGAADTEKLKQVAAGKSPEQVQIESGPLTPGPDPNSPINKPFAKFRQGVDDISSDLVDAGERGHTKSGVPLNSATRALVAGTGKLLEQVPVGRTAGESAQALVLSGEGPEGEELSAAKKAEQWKPTKLESTSNIPTEPGYVYHATNADRVHEIANTGKLDVHKPNYGTDQDAWPDGSTEKRSYFGKSADKVWPFAPEEGQSAIVRTAHDPAVHKIESGTGDVYATKKIPANKLEVHGTDGNWHPVSELAEPKTKKLDFSSIPGHSEIPATQAPKQTIENEGLKYKGEVHKAGEGTGVHLFEHPDHPGKLSIHEDDLTPEALKKKIEWKQSEPHPASTANQLPPQPRLPDTGTHAAIRTDDGSIYFDDAPEKQRTHIMLAQDLKIPPERVVSGGWLQDGHYEGSHRSDAGKWGERARAQKAVDGKRESRAPGETTPQAKTLSEQKNSPAYQKAIDDALAGLGGSKESVSRRKTTPNASGESSASQEAINRLASEKKAGKKKYAIDSRSGSTKKPLIGVDAVDYRPQPHEHVIEEDAQGRQTLLNSGDKARPWNPR